jgi:hypothetical protein
LCSHEGSCPCYHNYCPLLPSDSQVSAFPSLLTTVAIHVSLVSTSHYLSSFIALSYYHWTCLLSFYLKQGDVTCFKNEKCRSHFRCTRIYRPYKKRNCQVYIHECHMFSYLVRFLGYLMLWYRVLVKGVHGLNPRHVKLLDLHQKWGFSGKI